MLTKHNSARATLVEAESAAEGTQASNRPRSFLNVLSYERVRLFRFALVGLVFSTLLAFIIPPKYEAVARLMPPDQANGMGAGLLSLLTSKAGDGLGSLASDMLNIKGNSGALVTGVLSSDTVQDDIINRFDLRKVYWRSRYDKTRKILARRTDISEDRKSGIVTIRVEDRDPHRAQQIAQAYVEEANMRIAKLTTSSAHRERVFLEERLKEVKLKLDAAWLALSQFSSKNKTLSPELQGKAMLEASANLQGQLVAAESELKGVEQIYGPENSRVRAVTAKVGELRRKLQQLIGEGGSGELQPGQLYPSVQQLPVLGNTYLNLYREAKIEEAVFETLTKQYEMAKVSEAKEIPTIKELDIPTLPEGRSWPPRTLIVILGSLSFASLGAFLVYVERTAHRYETDDSRYRMIQWISRKTPHWLRGPDPLSVGPEGSGF